MALHNADNVVKVAICLHNYCLVEQESVFPHQHKYAAPSFVDQEVNGAVIPGQWRNNDCELDQIGSSRQKNPTVIAKHNRDLMAEFFLTDGEVPWQMEALNVCIYSV